jgi:hypothetical protein
LAVVVSACVFSRQFDDQGEAGVRYLAPVVVFAAILSARAMPQMIAALPTRRLRLAATVCFVTLAGGLLIGHTKMMLASLGTSPPWTARNGFLAVGRWLAAHHLTCGVGDYWSSSIITALTRGNVTVRAVWSAPEGHLVPVRWIDDDNWYRGTNTPSFAIWQERRESIPMQHVDAQAVAATYGTPLRLEHIADFTIAVLPLHSPQPGLTLRCPFADEALTPLPSPPNR